MYKDTEMIDTHCHLENDLFDEDRENVIKQAAAIGVRIITSAIDRDSWAKGCDIADMNESVYASIGLDPVNFDDVDSAIEWIRNNSSRIIAIGETGLDHFRTRDHEEREKQEQAFRKLIKIADELNLPIQIHSRSAGAKAISVLEDCEATSVHMHAFDGKSSHARRASRELDYYFSIPTSVIRSPQKRKLVKAVDIEHLLFETDSPVLGPNKGERNTPSNLPVVLREVASILRRDEEELREMVLENTHRLYSNIK
ncbi:MAG: TatD family hydrolase [Candidatus Thorarchaeota archaeon]